MKTYWNLKLQCKRNQSYIIQFKNSKIFIQSNKNFVAILNTNELTNYFKVLNTYGREDFLKIYTVNENKFSFSPVNTDFHFNFSGEVLVSAESGPIYLQDQEKYPLHCSLIPILFLKQNSKLKKSRS